VGLNARLDLRQEFAVRLRFQFRLFKINGLFGKMAMVVATGH
jgi:hypothetical protein